MSKESSGGSGCMGALSLVAMVGLIAWTFFGYAPKAAAVLGFQVWGVLVLVLVGVVLAALVLSALWRWEGS